jgi:IS605 OrfB family transposase
MKHEWAYHYRFYPTPDQDAILSRTFGCTRFVYNWGLHLRTDAWYDRQERMNYEATSAALTALKNERFFHKDEKQLAHAQRDLARKQPGSKKRAEQRRKVAKIHAAIADRRNDFLHKLTTRLIHENQVICVESLAVKHLLRNHSLAKAIADVGWGELIRQLEYKAAWYGRIVVAIDRFYPSSKRCHVCGYLLDSLSLDVREWECPTCHTVHDRDINAAITILAAGLAVYACGESVRPARATPAQATPREAGRSEERSLESPAL